MRKSIQKVLSFALAGAMVLQPLPSAQSVFKVNAGVASESKFDIPQADASGRVGAKVPYTRYDSLQANIGGGAQIASSKNFDRMNIASQASEQSYVRLPGKGAYAEWTMNTTGDGVTMRFTMPDSSDGMGLKGSLDVYVNGQYKKTIDLTSYFMWQYFASGNPSDNNDGGVPCFAFDEVHFKLDNSLKKGDTIRIQSSGANALEYGVDFLEIENVPDEIAQPDNSLNVEDFGAVPDDGQDDYDAIYRCIEEADRSNMDVYIPAGTFEIGQVWRLYGSNMKITGAGMWYTNIQFTNPDAGGGGISAGWQTSGSKDGYCNNIEFCNMYINSNLRSRYNQQAVYKCFMDVFTDGSVIHDIWEEHFECGFWFGDYNGKMDYSDGVKVMDCRIRNNLADGVNFCQGTSNATVYNCSIRNNGDDGLACWNNSWGGAKNESGNVFAYNTIDFIWRAGGIAIYGGDNFKVYNNYICDTFMAAGIHLNTTFDGYKFSECKNMTFDNNIIVRAGCTKDSWGEELGAVDIKQEVKNVTFNNTQIYDAQHDGIRILDKSASNVVFNNTKILGSGIDGQQGNYSSVPHAGAAIRLGSSSSATFNGIEIANSAFKNKEDGSPYFYTGGTDSSCVKNATIYDDDVTYTVPGYPEPYIDGGQQGGVTNPLEGITGYDIALTGLTWKNENGSSDLKNGDKVTFSVAITNTSNVDIPEGVTIGFKVVVDGTTTYRNQKFKDGLKAGQTVKLSTTGAWTASRGGHTIVATADDTNKLPNETDKNNNTRTKKFNVYGDAATNPVTRVSGGYDLVVSKIVANKQDIAVGDQLVFTATITNAGDTAIPAGTTIGYQLQIDGNTSNILWCDTYNSGLAAGQSVDLTVNSGSAQRNYWTATSGKHSIMAWVDDVNRIQNEVNEDNNKYTISLNIPTASMIENPDAPDDLNNPGQVETTKPVETTTKAPETTKPVETTTKAPETTAKPAETTTKTPETSRDTSGDIVLNEFMKTWTVGTGSGYQYMGQVNYKAPAGYRYLQLTYTGDTRAFEELRLEFFTDMKNPYWFNKNQAVKFVTTSGDVVEAPSSTAKTVVIDLQKSGLNINQTNTGFHIHNTQGYGSFTITDARLYKTAAVEQPTTKPVQTTTKQVETTTKAPETTTKQVETTTKEPETTKPAEAPSMVSDKVIVHGYQMSAKFNGVEGDMGIRIVYSVEPEIDGKKVEKAGVICGIVYGDNPITKNDIVLNSKNSYVASYEATDKGLIGDVVGDSKTAKNYVRTFGLKDYNAAGLSATYYTRSYAILEDGTIAYSNVEEFNIYEIGKKIYQKRSMVNEAAHNYLYDKILKVVNPAELPIDYNWSNTIEK